MESKNIITYSMIGKLENIDYHIIKLNERLSDMINTYKDMPIEINYCVIINSFIINGLSSLFYLSVNICNAYEDIKKLIKKKDDDVVLKVKVFFN